MNLKKKYNYVWMLFIIEICKIIMFYFVIFVIFFEVKLEMFVINKKYGVFESLVFFF